jgi:hypothetical protein
MSHINILDLDLSKLKLGKSGRTIKLIYEGNPLQLVTTKMYAPFGVKIFNNDYSHFTNCHIDCSISETNMKIREAYQNLDDKIKELVMNSNEKTFTEINFEDPTFYSSMFKGTSNYPKLMKISLPRDKNGNFDFVIFDDNKDKVKITESTIENVLGKRVVFKSIIECNKIWAYKGKVGVTWNLVQMRLVPKSEQSESSEPEENVPSEHNIYTQNMMIDD